MDNTLSSTGAALAILGSFFITLKISVFIGLWLYLGSSIMLLVWSLTQRPKIVSIFCMQLIFLVANCIGIVRWWP